MNLFDYYDCALVLILLYGSIMGFMGGFLATITRLLSPFAGLFVAYHLRDEILTFLGLELSLQMKLVASGVIFLVVSMLIFALVRILEQFLKKHYLGWMNHLLGLALGGAMALFFCWIASLGLTCFPQTREIVTHSRSAKYLVRLAEFSREKLPKPTEKNVTEPAQDGTVESKTSQTVDFLTSMSETFINRVQEQQEFNTETTETTERTNVVESDGSGESDNDEKSTRIHELLDALDLHISELLKSP